MGAGERDDHLKGKDVFDVILVSNLDSPGANVLFRDLILGR